MNTKELYKYIEDRTGMRQFHISFAEAKTEFSKEEAEELAACMESVCKAQRPNYV